MRNVVTHPDRIEAVDDKGRRVVLRFDEIRANGDLIKDMSAQDRDAWITRSVKKLQESK